MTRQLINTPHKLKRKALAVALTLAISPPLLASSPPNLSNDIPWSLTAVPNRTSSTCSPKDPVSPGYNGIGFSSVNDIMAAFNNARRQEEIQLVLTANTLGNLVLPSQTTWDGLSDDAKALYLINAERTARANMQTGVTGLPLAGIESKVDAVAQNYAQLLHDTDTRGHFQPSGNGSVDNPFIRIDNAIGSTCKEFLSYSENLAYFAAYSSSAIGESSVPLPVERAIYAWIYDDSCSSWGHRAAVLVQDFANNNGSANHEGFLGISRIGSTDYTPFGTIPSYPYSYGVAVVMNFYDPVSDANAVGCNLSVTLPMENLPNPLANTPPVATDDTASTAYQTATTISTVLANDNDANDDPMSVTANTDPSHGTVVRSGNSFTYTPATGFSGDDTFTYTVSDGQGGTDTATVTITVGAAPNTPPVATDDTASTAYQTATTISTVLANDNDANDDPMSVTANTDPSHGTVVRSGNSFTYTPATGFSGDDTFTYTVSDGQGGTDTATVTITVGGINTPPVATDDTASTAYQTATTISTVLANDNDANDDPMSVTANTDPSHGTVVRSGNSFTYTPATGFSGDDTFTYTVSDGQGGTDTATVTITVGGINTPPVATDDTASTAYQTATTISTVLAN
ncbi:cadherin-like domain-containing protein [Thiothrix lacustris]|uniref:Cadherin-like domain-containing protein n=1 Tax=Thiothrix lacustris TaxID=525917 RepID=A0ABY9MTH5_9GAMM|nr:cadherin-like domain-containing protein [Thiothrix lacustris]WML91862.1 cadherin-like domain-containing protein [Thiothrix lacustris]